MQKPENWNNIQAAEYGDYETLPPGGYICRIIEAREEQTMTGKNKLVLVFDICEGERKEFYKRRFDSDSRKDKKWQGTYHQLTNDSNGAAYANPFLKGLIKAIEQSNNFEFDWNINSFKGKIFGGVFGEEEYTKRDGTIGISVKCKYINAADKIRDGKFTVPSVKALEKNNNQPPATSTFVHQAEDIDLEDDELPF
jgi:hypothetical protein